MKILFLGNCFIWRAIRRLPNILNKIPKRNDVEITCLFISSFKIHHYTEYFETKLNQPLNYHKKNDENKNILFSYTYKSERYKREDFPDTSIKEVISKDWDIIVVCGHTGNASAWLYDKFEEWYKSCFNLIRKYSTAEIYWLWSFATNICYTGTHSCNTGLYNYGGECAIANNEEEMYEYLNSVDERICKENNVHPLKLRVAYESLIKWFPGYQRLLIDGIHPDKGLGEYFSSGFMYNTFLKDLYKVDLKDIDLNIDTSKCKYKYINKSCVSVNSETKKIADDILDDYFKS